MSKSVWIALVAMIGIGAMLFIQRPPQPGQVVASGNPLESPEPPPVGGGGSQSLATGAPALVAKAPGSAPTPATPEPHFVDLPEAAPGTAGQVHVRADRPLATVNGRSIVLKDMVPLETNETVRTMTQEEYQSRLERAIEVELTFQAAAAQGVGLTAAQQARLDGLAQRREAALEEYKKLGITWSSGTPAQLEFEKRVTSALMLQQNMVAQAVAVAPSSDVATQARYEQVRREILTSLRSKGNVNIAAAAP